MANNKWLRTLHKHEDVVSGDYNPHENVIRSGSPSLNFTFGKGHGLPKSLTLVMAGPPKGGKTLVCNSFTGQIHADNPDDMVIKFNTEFREQGQSTVDERRSMWGIDPDRYVVYETNSPIAIFDRIETEIGALCQEGMPLAAIIIDSVNGIQGRRAMDDTTVETQQRGDEALTLGTGFKRILAVQRKYKFALLLTCQIRAEQDPLEILRKNKVKFALPWSLQHYAEYFMYVEPNRNADAKKDLSGHEYKNEELGDIGDNAMKTGHKISTLMKDSSCGPKGRLGQFTLDYNKGIINTHEEVYLLGIHQGVIERPNNLVHIFGEQKWNGKPAILDAIKSSPALQKAILDEIYRRDVAGAFDAQDKANVED